MRELGSARLWWLIETAKEHTISFSALHHDDVQPRQANPCGLAVSTALELVPSVWTGFENMGIHGVSNSLLVSYITMKSIVTSSDLTFPGGTPKVHSFVPKSLGKLSIIMWLWNFVAMVVKNIFAMMQK